MSTTILIIDSNLGELENSKASLGRAGFGVQTATTGREGLQKAVQSRPQLVMVDAFLPDVDRNEMVRQLRLDPATSDLPIILLVDEGRVGQLMIGQESGADEFLIKPFSTAEVALKVRNLLPVDLQSIRGAIVSTGNPELDSKMGGGIPVGSLTLIEGDSGAGKSVLSQQLMWGSLHDGFKCALFTSENSVKSLVRQMESLNLDVLDFLLLGRFRVYPMEVARLGARAPQVLVEAMEAERYRDMIFVDSLTSAITHCSDSEVLELFEQCKRLCALGTTVVVVLHSHGVTRDLVIRLRSLCDAHFQLRTEEMGQKLVRALEVTKVRGAEKSTGNLVTFEVEPGWGMRLIPVTRMRG